MKSSATNRNNTNSILLGEDTEEKWTGTFLSELNPRQKIIIDLSDELPDSETDELLKTLEEKTEVQCNFTKS